MMTRVFVSHADKDVHKAERLFIWLEAEGFEPVAMPFGSDAGAGEDAGREALLGAAIAESAAVLIVVTPAWSGCRWCYGEYVVARSRGKLVAALIETGEDDGLIAADVPRFDMSGDGAASLTRLARALQGVTGGDQPLFDWAAPGEGDAAVPYPGLSAFTRHDGGIYFGRGAEAQRIVERMQAMRLQGGARLMALLGSAGSGASSLMRGGVLSRLTRASDEWIVFPTIRPGRKPLDALARSIAGLFGHGERWRDWSDLIRQAPVEQLVGHLGFQVRERLGAPEGQILLPIDQLEELYRLSDPAEASRFTEILGVALGGELPYMAVMALRPETLARLQADEVLCYLFDEVALRPMPFDSLCEIVRGPAERVGFEVEEALIEAIAEDAVIDDVLPCLGYALRTLFREHPARDERRLTADAYRRFGDPGKGLSTLENAIARGAEKALVHAAATSGEIENFGEVVLHRLVDRDGGGRFFRRPAPLADLPRSARRLLGELVRADIAVFSDEGEGPYIEFASEAVLRSWPRLVSWLSESSGLGESSGAVEAAGEALAGDGVEKAETSLRKVTLGERLRGVIGNGAKRSGSPESEVETVESESEAAASEVDGQGETPGLGAVRAVTEDEAAVSAVIEDEAAVRAVTEDEAAVRAVTEDEAAVRAVTEDEAAVRAVTEDEAAVRAVTEDEAAVHAVIEDEAAVHAVIEDEAAVRAVIEDEAAVHAVIEDEAAVRGGAAAIVEAGVQVAILAEADSPAGRSLVVCDSHEPRWRAHASRSVALLVALVLIISAGVILYVKQRFMEPTAPRLVESSLPAGGGKTRGRGDNRAGTQSGGAGEIERPAGEPGAVAWRPIAVPPPSPAVPSAPVADTAIARAGGQMREASGGGAVSAPGAIPPPDPIARDWDIASRAAPSEPVGSGTASVGAGDLARLAAARVGAGDTLTGLLLAVEAVMGRSVTGVSGPERIELERSLHQAVYDLAKTRQLKGHKGTVFSAVFSPDGKRIVTASRDRTARVWNVTTGKQELVLRGHKRAVHSAAFSPDGRRIITASRDETARIWDAATGKQLLVIRGHGQELYRASFSFDGKRVITASGDKTAIIWDAVKGHKLVVMRGHAGAVWGAILSPDGLKAVTVSEDNTGRLWNAKSGRLISVLAGHRAGVMAVAYSPDGRRIATTSRDGTVRLWDGRTGGSLGVLKGHGGVVISAAFNGDGTRLVTASFDGTARLWDVESGVEVAVLKVDGTKVWGASFGLGAHAIVTASSDGIVRIWPFHRRLDDLAELAISVAWRCLSAGERKHLGLAVRRPRWCRRISQRRRSAGR